MDVSDGGDYSEEEKIVIIRSNHRKDQRSESGTIEDGSHFVCYCGTRTNRAKFSGYCRLCNEIYCHNCLEEEICPVCGDRPREWGADKVKQ